MPRKPAEIDHSSRPNRRVLGELHNPDYTVLYFSNDWLSDTHLDAEPMFGAAVYCPMHPDSTTQELPKEHEGKCENHLKSKTLPITGRTRHECPCLVPPLFATPAGWMTTGSRTSALGRLAASCTRGTTAAQQIEVYSNPNREICVRLSHGAKIEPVKGVQDRKNHSQKVDS